MKQFPWREEKNVGGENGRRETRRESDGNGRDQSVKESGGKRKFSPICNCYLGSGARRETKAEGRPSLLFSQPHLASHKLSVDRATFSQEKEWIRALRETLGRRENGRQ